MTVREVMKKDAVTCAPTHDLTQVAAVMRARDCGFVPVIDSGGFLVGVLTDRDVCLAVASRQSLARVAVKAVMSHPVFSCFAEDNAKTALATMTKHHVRRLPVVDKAHGHLQGVLSLDDVAAAPRRRGAPTNDDVAEALRVVSARRPLLTAIA